MLDALKRTIFSRSKTATDDASHAAARREALPPSTTTPVIPTLADPPLAESPRLRDGDRPTVVNHPAVRPLPRGRIPEPSPSEDTRPGVIIPSRQEQDQAVTGAFHAMPYTPPPERHLPPTSASEAQAIFGEEVLEQRRTDNALREYDLLTSQLRSMIEERRVGWNVARVHLEHALRGDQRDPHCDEQAEELDPYRSAPLRPIKEQLDVLSSYEPFRHLRGATLPRFSGKKPEAYPSGLLVLPRIIERRFPNGCLDEVQDVLMYVSALESALGLLQRVLPRFQNGLCGHVSARQIILHENTAMNILGSHGSFDHIKLVPVQFGGLHLGFSYKKTMEDRIRKEEHGMDLYTAVIYLLSHADLIEEICATDTPCNFTCIGMKLLLGNGSVPRAFPTITFDASGVVRLSPSQMSSRSRNRGNATIYDPNRTFLTRVMGLLD